MTKIAEKSQTPKFRKRRAVPILIGSQTNNEIIVFSTGIDGTPYISQGIKRSWQRLWSISAWRHVFAVMMAMKAYREKQVPACKLLHIFRIIFLEFPVHPCDLLFSSPRQTSRRLIQPRDLTLRDRPRKYFSPLLNLPQAILVTHVDYGSWHFSEPQTVV